MTLATVLTGGISFAPGNYKSWLSEVCEAYLKTRVERYVRTARKLFFLTKKTFHFGRIL